MNKHLDGAINKMRLANMRLNEARGKVKSLNKEIEIVSIQNELGELMNRLRKLYKEGAK